MWVLRPMSDLDRAFYPISSSSSSKSRVLGAITRSFQGAVRCNVTPKSSSFRTSHPAGTRHAFWPAQRGRRKTRRQLATTPAETVHTRCIPPAERARSLKELPGAQGPPGWRADTQGRDIQGVAVAEPLEQLCVNTGANTGSATLIQIEWLRSQMTTPPAASRRHNACLIVQGFVTWPGVVDVHHRQLISALHKTPIGYFTLLCTPGASASRAAPKQAWVQGQACGSRASRLHQASLEKRAKQIQKLRLNC